MLVTDVLRAWRGITVGRRPSVSIEITRECPLRCPGCYAYEDDHLGGAITLRQLNDLRGDELVDGVLALVAELQPLHVSIVGGDPLVRYREVERIIPALLDQGIFVQLVTSAFRPLEPSWASMSNLKVVVSIDGLEGDHNVRRAPATYDKIIKNIRGQRVTVHCTITGQMMRAGRSYLEEFTGYWSEQPDVATIWFSLFTPQRGAELPEILTPAERARAIGDLLALRQRYPKVDMREGLIKEFAAPPESPDDCIFALTTHTISADLTTRITPCQFGGEPDCSQCGCIASMGLAAIANHRLAGVIPVGTIFHASRRLGGALATPRLKAAAARLIPALRD